MDALRKTLGALFAMLGAYYCVLSVLTLATLPSVTAQWVQRSGDPDFKYDYGMFMVWIGVGTGLVGAFGYGTLRKGMLAAKGRRESWTPLALGAPFLHWFWFLYRSVGNGVLDREAQTLAMRDNAVWFGSICVAYLAMWIVMRRGDSTRPLPANRMHPTTAAGQ